MLLLIAWHTVAALWAIGHVSPRPAVNMLWEWVGMGLCFFLARQLIVTPREVRAVVAVMIALAVALAGYGLYQYVYELPETKAEYYANPDMLLRNSGMWFPPGSPGRMLFESRLNNPEPLATFALTNSLAAFLAPWLVMLAGMIAASFSLQNRKWLWGMLLCFLPLAACLLMTKSRSGIIAAGVGIALVLLFRYRILRIGWKTAAVAAATTATLLVGIIIVGNHYREGISQASKSFGYRVQYWQSSLEMIADHPWVGCGPGNFQDSYTRYKLPEASEEIADPHNFLLEIWATAGTPALAAFLGVLGYFAWAQRRGQGAEVRAQESEGSKKGEKRREGEGERGRRANKAARRGGSSTATPSDTPTEADAWLLVLGGGMFGFLLSVPMGMLSAAPLGLTPVLIGLPLAIAAIACMFGWIRDGRLPRLLPAVSVAVMLVDMLTTGGIGFPSVAGTLWMLLALGLQESDFQYLQIPKSPNQNGPHPNPLPKGEGTGMFVAEHFPSRFASWLVMAAAVILAVACWFSAYRPVLECQTQLRTSEAEPDRAVGCLEAAATADPLLAEPWRQLAEHYFDSWRQSPSDEAFQRFERANGIVLERIPNSAPAWLTAGDWYYQASLTAGAAGKKKFAEEALQKSVASFRQAVFLYPNGAIYRAKLAEACLFGGRSTRISPGSGGRPAAGSSHPPSRQKTPRRGARSPCARPSSKTCRQMRKMPVFAGISTGILVFLLPSAEGHTILRFA